MAQGNYNIDHMNAHICPDGKIRYYHPCSWCMALRKVRKTPIKKTK